MRMIVGIAYGVCLVFAGYFLGKEMYVDYVLLMGGGCVFATYEGYIEDCEKKTKL